jgi:hypothetical protein
MCAAIGQADAMAFNGAIDGGKPDAEKLLRERGAE